MYRVLLWMRPCTLAMTSAGSALDILARLWQRFPRRPACQMLWGVPRLYLC